MNTHNITADDLNRRLTVSDSFYILINDINDAPLAYDIAIDVDEDNAQIIFVDFSDNDNDNSSISVSVFEAHLRASVSLSKVAKTDGYPLRRTLTVYDGLPFFCLV